MGELPGQLWDMLPTSLGMLVLGAVGLGLIAGLIRKAVDKRGATPVLMCLGGVVAIVLVFRYINLPVRQSDSPAHQVNQSNSHSRETARQPSAIKKGQDEVRWVQLPEANAICIYCRAYLNTGSRKGNTAINCAYCGGRQSAMQAILRHRAIYR
jgi:hypothetical protein